MANSMKQYPSPPPPLPPCQARVSDEDVDAERQIIVEEWRERTSAAMRSMEDYRKLLLHGSKYAERLPIGLMEVGREGGICVCRFWVW